MTLHGAYLAALQSVPPSLWRGPCQQWELWDDGTEVGAEESGAACAKVNHTVKWNGVVFGLPACTASAKQALLLLVD